MRFRAIRIWKLEEARLRLVAQRLAKTLWRLWSRYKHCKDRREAVDKIKYLMRFQRHKLLQKCLYMAMTRLRVRIVKAQRQWRLLQQRKEARKKALQRRCLQHELEFLEKAARIRKCAMVRYCPQSHLHAFTVPRRVFGIAYSVSTYAYLVFATSILQQLSDSRSIHYGHSQTVSNYIYPSKQARGSSGRNHFVQ
jgi:hypothetical protein